MSEFPGKRARVARRHAFVNCLAACVGALCIFASQALAEADGPDAWRVQGLGDYDTLNVRMGPGTQYPVIGELRSDARHLRNITCTPVGSFADYQKLTPSERDQMPARWCLIFDAADGQKGWVAGRFLAEDTLPPGAVSPGAQPAPTPAKTEAIPPPWDIAVPLVRNMYRHWAVAGSKLWREKGFLYAYFNKGVVDDILPKRLEADPLYGGQDSDVSNLSVEFDPERPIIQGLVTVLVRFDNFGSPQKVHVSLRADPQQGGAMRIICVEHESGQKTGC